MAAMLREGREFQAEGTSAKALRWEESCWLSYHDTEVAVWGEGCAADLARSWEVLVPQGTQATRVFCIPLQEP